MSVVESHVYRIIRQINEDNNAALTRILNEYNLAKGDIGIITNDNNTLEIFSYEGNNSWNPMNSYISRINSLSPALQLIRGQDEYIKHLPTQDGRLAFAVDSKKIYLDCDFKDPHGIEHKGLLSFGGNTGIYFGVKIFATDSAKQSTVYITYTIDGVDETVKSVLSDILSGSSYLCNEILRQKYKLVYSSGVMLHVYGGLFIVKANIDKDNLEKMVEATDEMVSIIQDPEKLKPLLEKAKESIKEADYVMSERSDRMLYELSAYIRNMNVGQNYKELIDNIDNVKPEDITKATKTLKKKNVFMFRGDAK